MNDPWYAVYGHPVSHSRSPQIHRAFAAQFDLALRYERIECDVHALSERLAADRAAGLAGANLTLPLKTAAMSLCQELSVRARQAGAVNTLIALADGGWRGDNTDGAGLLSDLTRRHEVRLVGARILLLGAGGAAQGVLPALLPYQPAEICVVNRTTARAQALAGQHGVAWTELDALADEAAFDLVINASSAGHQPQTMVELPTTILQPATVVCDLSYGLAAAQFLDWAFQAGVQRCIDGLGMLVEQAALAFSQWHGRVPETEPIYRALRAGELT
jgi:shikimate dehydrogenase